MIATSIKQLKNYLTLVESYFINASDNDIHYKESDSSWSKKEILGHLIDSGINNLQRFTEIQFETKPFSIRKYNQNSLVLANDYQHADLLELIGFWLSINKRIINLMTVQTEETLQFEIEIDDEYNNLSFLMKDYVVHMKHHINQIIE
ncbi:DinB family protein [Urechidicola vernalis]|uniref:DinB family protein n=1 Tax=Urechidicola vernalis TaxID=3075600 RepID=A0ABU2Y6S4_9FLAO|nr:DinB family protein [Urechidicola sp. P050]MDT0553896.1 DinB family protein [Urechidicola sp. P050]